MIKKYLPAFAISLVMVLSAVVMPSLSAVSVHAQAPSNTTSSGDKVQDGLSAIGDAFPAGARSNTYDVKTIAKKVIDWALYIAAIVAVVFIIVGGYMYIFSAGDQTKAGKGRTTMVNALIGLTMVVLSYMIVQIVYKFLTDPN